MNSAARCFLVTGVILALGCGENRTATFKSVGAQVPMAEAAKEMAAGNKPAADQAKQPPAAGQPEKALPRKIIYTAQVSLVAKVFEDAQTQLLQLVKEHEGFVAQSDIQGSTGSPRSGRWTVRIPVNRFEAFMGAVVEIGIPERNTVDSRDVTEEFYDVEARLKNKRVEEERLLDHLKKSTGKLEEILAVEREISRVRGEIEQLEGRLRLLANLSDLTTVTVNLREVKDYVPPQAPTFGNQISSTFRSSLERLQEFGKAFVLVVVALVPWLPIIAVVLLPFWLLIRWVARNVTTPVRPATVLPAPPEE